MSLIVEKFGGTSVGTIERINIVADQLVKRYQAGESLVVVVSAMSGETNRLIEMGKQIGGENSQREMDMLVATGEQVTISLLAMAIQQRGVDAISFTGSQVAIQTDSDHAKARIVHINSEKIITEVEQGKIVVIAGFQGVDEQGNVTTLGRGGSDTTAAAVAVAVGADECRIYTDVDGVYTTDPRVVEEAQKLETITGEEMLEMSSLGAKVLQTRSVEFARKYQLPLRVLSSFEEGSGTLITYQEEGAATLESPIIAGIAFQRDEAKLTIRGIPDHPGIAYQVLGPVADANINVDVILQNASAKGFTDLTFTVPRSDYQECLKVLTKLVDTLDAKDVKGDDKIAKVSIVGVGMRSHTGVASTMFKTLSDNGINIQMISTSEIKISVIIDEQNLDKAVQSLHDAFKLQEANSKKM